MAVLVMQPRVHSPRGPDAATRTFLLEKEVLRQRQPAVLESVMGKLIMVSNRLPVHIESDGSMRRTTGGLASALEGAALEIEQIWVGWPGGAKEDFEDLAKVRSEMRESGVAPVFLSKDDLDGFY
jgi:trehalose-6-phosphate synthase